MIARTPDERMYYEARLKFQRDETSRLLDAEEQGRNRGIQEGIQMGRIWALQQFLGLPETSAEELKALSSEAVAALLDDLQQQLRERH